MRESGQNGTALQILTQVNKDVPGWNGLGMDWYATAIAHRRLGHEEDARWSVDRADA
jgi:hypothetical protein